MPDIFVSPPTSSQDPSRNSQSRSSNAGYHIKGIHKALGTFLYKPKGVRFETQAEGEEVILLLRGHWFTNLMWILLTIILILTPSFLFPFLLSPNILQVQLPSQYLSFLILAWYLATFSYLLVNFLLWYFNVGIVTTDRIVDIDFINVLLKHASETRIEKVEDVTSDKGGFIRTVLDYGDVYVQTAGEKKEFEFLAVPQPEEVVRIINDLMGEKKEIL